MTADSMPPDAGAPSTARLRGVSKRFGFTDALAGVDLTIRAGEVLALLGENGAGKSTLVKVLTGVIAPDSGTIEVDGVEHDALTPRRAEDLGIARVAQELSLFPEMDVAANVLIGREPTPLRAGRPGAPCAAARASCSGCSACTLDPRLPVRRLALAERQLVEIAKAMARNPAILVLDEPTSGLARARGGAAVPRDRPPARAGLRHRVHQPSDGRGVRHRRSHHRAQGRPQLRRGRLGPTPCATTSSA